MAVLLPGKSHGQRSLVGYRPQGCKELDTTERLYLLTHSKRKTFTLRERGATSFPLPATDASALRDTGIQGLDPPGLNRMRSKDS